jgi:hypothetical protein
MPECNDSKSSRRHFGGSMGTTLDHELSTSLGEDPQQGMCIAYLFLAIYFLLSMFKIPAIMH